MLIKCYKSFVCLYAWSTSITRCFHKNKLILNCCLHFKATRTYSCDLPFNIGTQGYITSISDRDIDWAKLLVSGQSKTGDANVDRLLTEMCTQENIIPPTTWKEALATYFRLLELLDT